jgi:hypothetical protein
MTYEEFKAEYEALVNRFMSYGPKTIGYAELGSQLADLVEQYPEFEEMLDNEVEAA